MAKKREPATTAKLAADICELVSSGQTLRQVATKTGLSLAAIGRITGSPEHAEQYAHAREAATDLFETDIIEAALSATPETAAADRVKIDALKWVAARRSPKKYGDRIQQDVEIDFKDGLAEKLAAARARAVKG